MGGMMACVWGASSLINLIATCHAGDILSTFGCPCYVVPKAMKGEVLYLRPLLEEDSTGALLSVDKEMNRFLEAGLIEAAELTSDEQDQFVMFAGEISDDEARILAVAANRGWHVVTDDRPALRVMSECVPSIPFLTTPDWMKSWAETHKDDLTLRKAIRRVEECAHGGPRRNHPLFDWWKSNGPT